MKKLILITLLLIPLNTWAEEKYDATLHPNYYAMGLIWGTPIGTYSSSGEGVYTKTATNKTSSMTTSKNDFVKSMSFGLYTNYTVNLERNPPINILLEFMVTPTLVLQGGFGLGGTIQKGNSLHSLGLSLGVGAGKTYEAGTTFYITDKKDKNIDSTTITPTDLFTTKITPAFYYHFISGSGFSLLLKAGIDFVISDATYVNDKAAVSDSYTFNYQGLSVRPSIYIGFGGEIK